MAESTKRLIFFVDDNQNILRLVHDLLGAHGFRVVCLTDGLGLLERAAQEKPDLILMDMTLKGESGLELIVMLKSDPRTSSIPVVALSAHSTDRDKLNALSSGCNGFITKPIDTRNFPAQVNEYIIKEPKDYAPK